MSAWQVYLRQDLWASYGSLQTRCLRKEPIEVADRSAAQFKGDLGRFWVCQGKTSGEIGESMPERW